jgi:hypothetical protein
VPTERHRRFTDGELRTVARWWRRWRCWSIEETQIDAGEPVERRGVWFLSVTAPGGFWGNPGSYDYAPWGYSIVAAAGDTVELVEPDGVQSAAFADIGAALHAIREMPAVASKITKGHRQAA